MQMAEPAPSGDRPASRRQHRAPLACAEREVAAEFSRSIIEVSPTPGRPLRRAGDVVAHRQVQTAV